MFKVLKKKRNRRPAREQGETTGDVCLEEDSA